MCQLLCGALNKEISYLRVFDRCYTSYNIVELCYTLVERVGLCYAYPECRVILHLELSVSFIAAYLYGVLLKDI
jgi:hypothetical protein